MPSYEFIWTDDVLEKLALRDIEPSDVESIVERPTSVDVSRSSARPIAFGFLSDSRFVAVVYEFYDGIAAVVTAFEVDLPS